MSEKLVACIYTVTLTELYVGTSWEFVRVRLTSDLYIQFVLAKMET